MKMTDYSWKEKSIHLDNDIQDLFKNNDNFSMEIIKQRVMAYKRTSN